MKQEGNEKALLLGLARNDKKAVETIYKENYNMVQSLVINNNGTTDDAKDIFQEAMIVLYEKARSGTFELNCQIKTYVYSVCRRLWLKKLQQANRFMDVGDMETAVPVEDDIEDHSKKNAEFEMMDKAIGSLGEPCKSLLEAYYLQKKNMQEIAFSFGYTNAENAKNQKYKCLMRLKKYFLLTIKTGTVMNDKNDIMMLDAVERYIRGEMNPDERLHFENLRKTNSEIDQLVVEHTLFLQQINQFGERKNFKSELHNVHTDLAEKGKINSDKLSGKAKVVYLWKRYRRVAAIAASIAGITTLTISALVWSLSPKSPADDIERLNRIVIKQEQRTNSLEKDLDKVKDSVSKKANLPALNYKTVGTGFLINGRGLMITNAHVVKNSKNIRVFNTKGEQFNAFVVKLDVLKDVAIIKVDDNQFRPFTSLPYGISKTTSDIAEPIFTLGFPRDEIVYGEGYLSAPTGFNGDTLSYQISVDANPGNSGGPVFNRNGEVIGILSTRETHAEGAVFAIQSKYIYKAINELKKNPLYENIKISLKSSVNGLDRVQQANKIKDYIFMVKGD